MRRSNHVRVLRINPSRFVRQAEADLFSAAHALTEASQLAPNQKTGMRLANLARAANLTAHCFARIVRELGRKDEIGQ